MAFSLFYVVSRSTLRDWKAAGTSLGLLLRQRLYVESPPPPGGRCDCEMIKP